MIARDHGAMQADAKGQLMASVREKTVAPIIEVPPKVESAKSAPKARYVTPRGRMPPQPKRPRLQSPARTSLIPPLDAEPASASVDTIPRLKPSDVAKYG